LVPFRLKTNALASIGQGFSEPLELLVSGRPRIKYMWMRIVCLDALDSQPPRRKKEKEKKRSHLTEIWKKNFLHETHLCKETHSILVPLLLERTNPLLKLLFPRHGQKQATRSSRDDLFLDLMQALARVLPRFRSGGALTLSLRAYTMAPTVVAPVSQPVVLCGPSGAGKSTLIKKLQDEFPGQYNFSVSR
jgi:HrpA-like RNA helicase